MQGKNALIVFMDKFLLKCFPATVPGHIPSLAITSKYISCYYFANNIVLKYWQCISTKTFDFVLDNN